MGVSKPFDLKSMEPVHVGEQYGRSPIFPGSEVSYLSEVERQMLRVEIRDGLLYDASGQPIDTELAATHFSGQGKAIYVMGPDGHIYISNFHQAGKFHHSSILAGQPVASAGEIVVEDGVVTSINRRSGHYRPGENHTDQIVDELGAAGVDTDNISIGGWA